MARHSNERSSGTRLALLFGALLACASLPVRLGLSAPDEGSASITIANPHFDALTVADFEFGTTQHSGALIPDGSFTLGCGGKVDLRDARSGNPIAGAVANVAGWALTGTGGAIRSSESFPAGAPEGSAGFLLLASDSAEAALAQTLVGTRLQPQTRYTLSVRVFDRDSRNAAQQDVVAFPRRVSLQLLAGTTVLKSMSGPSANGGGRLWSLEYDSPAENLPPDDLTIVLGAAGFAAEGAVNAQVVFDDVSLSAGPLGTTREADPRELAFFESRIRPVLAQHCLKCHSGGKPKGGLALDHRDGWRQGGDSGPALAPGKPDESVLLAALRYENFEMPPTGRLPDNVVQDFATWIEHGAVDPRTSPPLATKPTDAAWEDVFQERLGWWSLQPLVKPAVPAVALRDWPRGEVDHFILAAIEARQLAPAAQADHRTLGRRLSFALLGLPPTAAALERLAADPSPSAYENYVDELLESPQFGEHWARHWMDIVHYSDTHGYEWDIPAHEAWRYRDYLIRAFNADVPYNRLIEEHLAGDLLADPRVGPEGINESIIAPMGLRMGERRHGDNGSAISGGVTEEAIDNVIDTLGKAFLATTVGCSQCHNHKLDAVSQHDYYALAGALMSSRWVMRSLDRSGPDQQAIDELRGRKTQLRQALAGPWLAAVDTLAERLPGLPVTPAPAGNNFPDSPLALWNTLRLAPDAVAVEASWTQLAKQWLALGDERRAANERLILIADFTTDRVPTGWQLEGLGMRSGLARSGELVVADEGARAIVHVLPAGRWTHAWSQRWGGAVRGPLMDQWAWPSIQVGGGGGAGAAWQLIVDNALFPEEHMTYFRQPTFGWVGRPTKVGRYRTYFELSTKAYNNNFPPRVDLSPGGEEDPRSWFGITRVYAASAPADELGRYAELFEAVPQVKSLDEAAAAIAAWLRKPVARWAAGRATDEDVSLLNSLLAAGQLPNDMAQTAEVKQLVEAYRQIESKLPGERTVGSLADMNEGRNERLRIRGSYTDLAEEVPRGNIRLLEPERTAAAQADSGRREIARNWADPQNPLASRVMVNRVWNYLFGEGLVRTPDDFGHLGALPSHPELLDWLASQYVEDGWSTKRLIRRLVTSAAWRQSGAAAAECLSADPDNTLWHHMPPRRLEAEAIRDSLLCVAGRLDARLYGPTVEPFRAAEDTSKRLLRGPLDGNGRRSIYIKMTLMEPPRFLALFNQPIPKQTFGHRDVTNVPDQALALLNDPLVQALARVWSERIVGDGAAAASVRAQAMFLAATARPPTADESQRLVELVQQSAGLRQVPAADILGSVAVWQDVAHALFNLKEFIYIP